MFRKFHIIVLMFVSLSIGIVQAEPSFKIDLKNFVNLNNKNILRYKINKIDNYHVKINGKLKDQSDFIIDIQMGDVFSITHKKIIHQSSSHSFKEKSYWVGQISEFAKVVWKKSDYDYLLQQINQYKSTVTSKKNAAILRLEKYDEGNYKELKITKLPVKTIIELHQAAC